MKANPAYVEEKGRKRDEMKDPYWIHDSSLQEGARDYLSEDEIKFWNEFIPQYLKPLESNKEQEKQVSMKNKKQTSYYSTIPGVINLRF